MGKNERRDSSREMLPIDHALRQGTDSPSMQRNLRMPSEAEADVQIRATVLKRGKIFQSNATVSGARSLYRLSIPFGGVPMIHGRGKGSPPDHPHEVKVTATMEARKGGCIFSLTHENQTDTKGYLVRMDFEWQDLGRPSVKRR